MMADAETTVVVSSVISEVAGEVDMPQTKEEDPSPDESVPVPVPEVGEDFDGCKTEENADIAEGARVRRSSQETLIVESAVSAEETPESDFKVDQKEEIDEEKCKEEIDEDEEEEEAPDASALAAKTITVAEEDIEDDIIVLDDEEESGASGSKRPRKDEEDEIMEVDENGIVSKEEREMVEKIIRQLPRNDLEDLVLAKIVEALVAHTEVGQLRSQVSELTTQKDKMAGKMGVMMKQVAELSSAVHIIVENEARDPKNRIGKPHVIRFNRSVGLQTSIEPSVRSAPPKIIRVPEASQNGLKQYGSSTGKQPVFAGATNGTFNPPQGPAGVKRFYAANKSGDNKPGVSQTAAIQPSPRKTYSPASAPPRIHPIAPKPIVSPQSSVTVTPISQNVQPGIVDLTDDDPPTATSTPQSSSHTLATTTMINGVQYQILNRTSTPTGGVQIVSPGTQAQPKFIVTPTAGQNRPVVLQQYAVGSGTGGNQQFILRGVPNASNPVVIQRPVAPRLPTNGSMPRVAATIPVRPNPTGVVLGSNTQRRFVLPPLPTTPTPKQKNDMFRPPPKPELTLNEQTDGIVLSWNLPTVNNMAEVTTYQIFACQESLTTSTNRPSQWKRVGDVKALPLPMACTLSQFTEENRYYFIVRGIDVYGRVGPFCDPQNILLRRKK